MERKVEIPVERKTREKIIKAKKGLTYDEYFNKVLGCKCA